MITVLSKRLISTTKRTLCLFEQLFLFYKCSGVSPDLYTSSNHIEIVSADILGSC